MLTGKGWMVTCVPKQRIGKNILECFTQIDLGMGCFWVSLASNCIERCQFFAWIHNVLWVNGSDCHTEIRHLPLAINWGYLVLFEIIYLSARGSLVMRTLAGREEILFFGTLGYNLVHCVSGGIDDWILLPIFVFSGGTKRKQSIATNSLLHTKVTRHKLAP